MSIRIWIAAGVVAGVLALTSPAAAEDVPFVDGTMWKKSAPILKRTYLVGFSNLLSAEYAYQKAFGPPPDRQTAIQRLYEEIDDVTLDGAIAKIDAWYGANPEQMDTTVVEVIWLQMVRPNLSESRRYNQDD
jgi:hypothetical protein